MTLSCSLLGLQPEEYSADELKDAEKVTEAIEAQTGGQLQTYTPSDEDAVHWWVFEVIHLMPSVRMVPEFCRQIARCYSYPFASPIPILACRHLQVRPPSACAFSVRAVRVP